MEEAGQEEGWPGRSPTYTVGAPGRPAISCYIALPYVPCHHMPYMSARGASGSTEQPWVASALAPRPRSSPPLAPDSPLSITLGDKRGAATPVVVR
jgi:hypothetical protein